MEVMVALAVLTLSSLAMTSTLASTHALEQANRTRRSAENALRAVSEQLMAFSDASLDDPAGWANTVSAATQPGGVIGNTFFVRGLTLPAGVPTAGTIQLVTDETLTDAVLGARLGMPRDLNGNGLAAEIDVSGNAVLLPVIVRVSWVGATGPQTIFQGFYLLGY